MKTENQTLLHSTEYWRDVDYAIIGSLADVPCKRGKGVEGKGEWEVIYRQKGYAGITWQQLEIPDILWNNTYVNTLNDMYVNKVCSNEHLNMFKEKVGEVWERFSDIRRKNLDRVLSNDHVRNLKERFRRAWDDGADVVMKYVNRISSNAQVKKLLGRVEGFIKPTHELKVPWVKLEDKIFILKHMRKEDFVERNKMLEEQKEKERKGLGKQGEVEGQWRDFY
jgi:hypothetical protein